MIPDAHPGIHVLGEGLIFSNPQPHLRCVQAMHPSLALSSDGTLVAAFDLGETPESLDYQSYFACSSDLGKTWSAPTPFFSAGASDRGNCLVRIRAMADGEIVGLGVKVVRDDPRQGFFNRAVFGYAPTQLFITRSHDRGRHWTAPQWVDPPLPGPFELCHPIVELRNGRWLAPMSTLPDWQGRAPNGTKAIALVSHDRGRSWPDYLITMFCSDRSTLYLEQGLVELHDGRLLSTAWAFQPDDGQTQKTSYALADDGRTFAGSRLTGFHAQTTKIACLHDDSVLAVYRRHDRPGLWVMVATIDGRDWKNRAEVLLWQGSGMTGSAAPAQELAELKFGSPNIVELPDHTVMCAFWCHEGGSSVIRWMRLNVS